MSQNAKRSASSVGQRMLGRLQAFARDLRADRNISELYTCRRVALNLQSAAHDAKSVKATRRTLKASQTLFAHFLGVSPRTVRAWEQGELTPNGIAGRFLDEIRRNPDYWRKRFEETVVCK